MLSTKDNSAITQVFVRHFKTLQETLAQTNLNLQQQINQLLTRVNTLQLEVTENTSAVTKESLELQNVNNTSDVNKPLSIACTNALALKQSILDESNPLPQLYVEDLVSDLAQHQTWIEDINADLTTKQDILEESNKLPQSLVTNLTSDLSTHTSEINTLKVRVNPIPTLVTISANTYSFTNAQVNSFYAFKSDSAWNRTIQLPTVASCQSGDIIHFNIRHNGSQDTTFSIVDPTNSLTLATNTPSNGGGNAFRFCCLKEGGINRWIRM